MTVFGETQQFTVKQIEPTLESADAGVELDNDETAATETGQNGTDKEVIRVVTTDTEIQFEKESVKNDLTFMKFDSAFVARDLTQEVEFAGFKEQRETLEEILCVKIRDQKL